MKNILLIASREISVKARKKTFILMTLLAPIGMLIILIVPYWLTSTPSLQNQPTVQIIDQTGFFNSFPKTMAGFSFKNIKQAQEPSSDLTVIISSGSPVNIDFYGNIHNSSLPELVRYIVFSKLIHTQSSIKPSDIKLKLEHRTDHSGPKNIKLFMSYGSCLIIYFFIFLYGIQIMKGIIEEKSNRIIEVMLTTIKPIEMMLGKILGIGTLGLIQFTFLITSSATISYLAYDFFQINMYANSETIDLLQQANKIDLQFLLEMNTLSTTLQELNIPLLLLNFTLFFILGFLVFASLFAIAGAASDLDTDTQQFLFPITVPLITAMVLIQPITNTPDSTMANWLSYIPLTAPIITTARLPFYNHIDEFFIKWTISLIITFCGFVTLAWAASRVYKIGIMKTGVKITYKDISKWITSSN